MAATRFQFLAPILLAAASTLPAFSQTVVTSGTIRGLVTDPTGAVIYDAIVDVVQRQTGVSSTSRSNHGGLFVFSALPIGPYSVKVSAPGFQTGEMKDVSVTVGQATAADFVLHPGAATQVMLVTAKTPTLRTTDSTLSAIVDRDNLNNLPLSGRRYTDFSLLTPNSTPDGQAGLVSFAGEQGGEDTGYANGNGANSFTLDGASATSNYFGNARGGERVPYVFGENAIQEFQVAVSPYSAAYGGGATGFLNTVTKSGADAFHGNAFYYNRNSGTGANDAISKANGIPKPVDILQQFGASVGGPLVKQKAWFFFDYEQQRHKNPISVINSGFNNLDATDFGLPDGTVLPNPNGQLPIPGAVSQPDPNSPIYLQQVSNAISAIQSNLGTHSRYANDLALFSKIDYQASSNDRLYLSLNLNRFDSPNGEITNSQTALFGISTLANSYVRDYHASVGWTHAFSPTLLSETHASFSRDGQYSTPTGYMSPTAPSILISAGGGDEETGLLQIGNAGFAKAAPTRRSGNLPSVSTTSGGATTSRSASKAIARTSPTRLSAVSTPTPPARMERCSAPTSLPASPTSLSEVTIPSHRPPAIPTSPSTSRILASTRRIPGRSVLDLRSTSESAKTFRFTRSPRKIQPFRLPGNFPTATNALLPASASPGSLP